MDKENKHTRQDPVRDTSGMTRSELEFELWKKDPDLYRSYFKDSGPLDSVLRLDYILDSADIVKEYVIDHFGPVYAPRILMHAYANANMDAGYRGDMQSYLDEAFEDIKDASEMYREYVDIEREHLSRLLDPTHRDPNNR